MRQINISRATPGDWEIIQAVGRQTFFETFAQSNTEANMKQYLDESFSAEKVKAELNNPDSQFYIAWNDKEPIGYLKLNSGTAQTALQGDTAIEIERIYVKHAYHGKKVGQRLIEKALEIALLEQRAYIWLAVWENNPKAISFYQRNGFTEFDKHIFRLGHEEQTDIMMKKEIGAIN